MSRNKEYMKKYMLDRYHRRRKEAIYFLGGECSVCGSIESLEIDHKESKEKTFTLSKAFAGWSESRVKEELKKCQLLCYICHSLKTRKELSERFNQKEFWEHGTLSGVRYCSCELCLKAKRDYNKEYHSKKSKNKNTPP